MRTARKSPNLSPAMLILIAGCLAVAGAAWSVVYSKSAAGAIALILKMVFRKSMLDDALTPRRLCFVLFGHCFGVLVDRQQIARHFPRHVCHHR